MRQMMLDGMKLSTECGAGKHLREKVDDTAPLSTMGQTVDNRVEAGRMRCQIREFAPALRAVILIDGNMIDVAQTQPRFGQAVGDRLLRKPRPMLDAAKPLFLGRGNQLPVA